MRKAILAILELWVLIVCLSGCDRYRGPECNPNDLWVSENPPISFVAMNEEKGCPTGEMMVDGELIEIDVMFDNGGRMAIFKAVRDTPYCDIDDELVRARIDIRGDKMIASVIYKQAGIWENIDEVTFTRRDLYEESYPCHFRTMGFDRVLDRVRPIQGAGAQSQ